MTAQALVRVQSQGRPERLLINFRVSAKVEPPKTLGMIYGHHVQRGPTMRAIGESVAKAHGYTLEQLQSGSRLKRVCFAKHEAMWTIRQVKSYDGTARYSYPQIARFFGLKDHTSAINGCRRHEARLIAAAASRQAWDRLS